MNVLITLAFLLAVGAAAIVSAGRGRRYESFDSDSSDVWEPSSGRKRGYRDTVYTIDYYRNGYRRGGRGGYRRRYRPISSSDSDDDDKGNSGSASDDSGPPDSNSDSYERDYRRRRRGRRTGEAGGLGLLEPFGVGK